jgi:hypothetical protein
MAVLSDYKCETHGYFESRKAQCPMKGCDSEVYQVFLQAPGYVTSKTKATDRRVKQLAIDFDMSNIKSTRVGENQAGYLKRNNKLSDKEFAEANEMVAEKNRAYQNKNPQPEESNEPKLRDSVIWGGGKQETGMNMQSVLKGQFNRPVGAALGVENELTSFAPSQAGIKTGPKTASYIADPDNLKIKR